MTTEQSNTKGSTTPSLRKKTTQRRSMDKITTSTTPDSENDVTELNHLRDLNIINSNHIYELTMEKMELQAKIRDLEFENKRLNLENVELLNRIDDHYKAMENLSNIIKKNLRPESTASW